MIELHPISPNLVSQSPLSEVHFRKYLWGKVTFRNTYKF